MLILYFIFNTVIVIKHFFTFFKYYSFKTVLSTNMKSYFPSDSIMNDYFRKLKPSFKDSIYLPQKNNMYRVYNDI